MKYNIYEFTIRDDEYYPEGTSVCLANDKDMKAIKDAGDDDLIYHYVDDEIDLPVDFPFWNSKLPDFFDQTQPLMV